MGNIMSYARFAPALVVTASRLQADFVSTLGSLAIDPQTARLFSKYGKTNKKN